MLRRWSALCLALSATGATAATAQHPVNAEAEAASIRYRELLGRLVAGDSTIDFTALRIAWTKSPDYDPYHYDAGEQHDRLNALLSRREYRRAVELADSALSVDYLNPRSHAVKAYAAEQLGDTAAAVWHRLVASSLVHSVTRTGTGTVDSPFVVVSLAEEYAVLGMMGYGFGGQALGECGTRPCDVVTAFHRQSREKRTFYFDISLLVADR